MTIDLTGGLDAEREFVLPGQPDDPEMRESVNAWIWDDGAEFGLPRVGIEAVGDQWETHDIQVNIALADGRVFNIFDAGKVHDPIGADGRPRTLGAGPLSYELVEPFRHWRGRLDGLAVQTTVRAQIDGSYRRGASDGPLVPVELALDLRSAVPPWEGGTLLEEAGLVLATQEEGALMGGPRFEQLFRASGRLRLGDEVYDLNGGGLRIRRAGIRRLAAFRGHVWQSALFPSGRAFGLCLYPPRPDGRPTFNEGYLFDGDGELIPARVTRAPWLRELRASGGDVSVTLETSRGETTIEGQTILSTFATMGADIGSASRLHLQQALARYSWDGETANGMIERSAVLG
ncbi:hypothetical protein ACG83_19450 [Frankia sp. R43]|uniref:hypothetical protein n=1 Tax=Frankia sp. R43 TaxID=269536 RepID=UPI0006C9F3CB|nr:hypothetical protein [Frankia sp. R43]KPM54184.1 hypothetical protein ACG83_19450 [Frankia sp. R43]